MNKGQRHIIFSQMVRQYGSTILRVCTFFCGGDIDKMKDLQQDIYCALWESIPRYKRKCNPCTWLYRVALHTAVTRHRHQASAPDFVPIDDALYLEAAEEQDNSHIEELYRLIEQLSADEKTLILLYLDRKPIQEISQILGLSTSAVNHRIAKIKDKLKKINNDEQK